MNKWRANRLVVEIIAAFVLLAALVSVPLIITQIYWVDMMEMFFIWALFAMSLDLLAGYCGLMSFGHSVFFGVSAYVIGILTSDLHFAMFKAVILAILATVFLALVVSALVAHLKGAAFMMVTLAIAQVFWGLAYQWVSVTGGDNGITGIAKPMVAGSPISELAFYYLILAVVVFCSLILFFITQSPLGLVMKGIKQSESRMRVLGYNVWLFKYTVIVITGLFAAIAGAMWVQFIGFVGPDDLSLSTSAQAILMVLAGGAGTLFGPAIGSFAIVFLQNVVSSITQRWLSVMGIIYVVVVFFLPRGILGAIMLRFKSGGGAGLKKRTIAGMFSNK